MTAIKEIEKSRLFIMVLGCLAFSFFWGNNTVVFSSLLSSSGYEALVQMLWRGFFLVGFAIVFYSVKKVPLSIMFCVLGLQICVLLCKVTGARSIAQLGPFLIVAYGCYMSFFLLCFVSLFFSFPKKIAIFLVTAGLIGSYVVSILLYRFDIPPQICSLLSLCSTFTVCMCLQGGNTSPKVDNKVFSKELFFAFAKEVKSHLIQFPTMFSGSVVLLLLVFEIWFQLNNADVDAVSGFSTMLYGVMCIAAIIVFAIALRISEDRTVYFFSAVSLVAFLVSQIAVLLFWQNALFIMAIITGIWFALYQFTLLLYCRISTDAKNDFGFSTALFGLALGGSMFVLVLGNGIARVFLLDLTLDYSVLSTLAFTMTVILVVALAVEITLHVRRILSTAREPAGGVEEPGSSAIDLLCTRFQISPREKEVMEIYSQGRSVEYIAEYLVLSKHTVKTHLRRLYVKLDIHSKEDLLDLLEKEKISCE